MRPWRSKRRWRRMRWWRRMRRWRRKGGAVSSPARASVPLSVTFNLPWLTLVVASFVGPPSVGPIHKSTDSISAPSAPSTLRLHTGIHRVVYSPFSLKYLRPCPSILLNSQQLISTSSFVGVLYNALISASHLAKLGFVVLTRFHSSAAICAHIWFIISKTSIASSSEGTPPTTASNSRDMVRKAPATNVQAASSINQQLSIQSYVMSLCVVCTT